MKRLIFSPLLLLFIFQAKAQNNRWMFLSNDHGLIYMIDTLKNDIKQLENYEGRENVVMIWLKTVEKKSNKKGSYTESMVARVVIDTTINQIEVTSAVMYHNNVQLAQNGNNYVPWRDVVPESGGDVLIDFCRALNNHQLMKKFIANAEQNDLKYSLPAKKKKSR